MEILMAEMERKRKQIDSNQATAKKKFVRRGELVQIQAEEYRKKQEEKMRKKLGDGEVKTEAEASSSNKTTSEDSASNRWVDSLDFLSTPNTELFLADRTSWHLRLRKHASIRNRSEVHVHA